MRRTAFLGAAALALAAASAAAVDNDPYLWLSDIHGERPLAWVKRQDARSDAALKSDPGYGADYAAILKSLDIPDRIPLGRIDHGYVYNFWQDAAHARGIWRRTTVADDKRAQPNWDILLDVDKLDADEHAQFVWQGATCAPDGDLCLVRLSPGGGDATTLREFDLKTRTFVKDGFALPLAKSDAAYLDKDTILFGTNFGVGSMTTSSYPRIVELWHRGTPIGDARTIFEAKASDVAARPRVFQQPGSATALIDRGLTFFTSEFYQVYRDGSTKKLPLPKGADLKGMTGDRIIFILRDDWRPTGSATTFRKGSLVSYDLAWLVRQWKAPQVQLLYAPGPHDTIGDVEAGRDAVYAAIYHNVTGSVAAFRYRPTGWRQERLALPEGGSVGAVSADAYGPDVQFTYESFLQPPTLYATDGASAPVAIKSQAPLFDASGLVAEQFWTTSKDGTKIPYFFIHPKGQHGPLPTILYSYGGFEDAIVPWYWNDGHRPLDAGQVWLAKGGAIAVANIRGGGEFGPRWHQAALKQNRQRAFDDFAAVGRDVERRGFATPKMLGIVGASNGGILTTVTMTQHPDLLAAVVCQRPLIDMLRYAHFGAGASWIGEYGDPDKPADRKWLAKYSAYENVKPGVHYPPVLFITETNDDRVTPVWARMMAAKMEAQGHDVLFNESSEGGHGPGATNAAQAQMWALSYTYLAQKLGLK